MKVLYVSDPGFPAQGRDYGEDARRLVSDLRSSFDIEVCGPTQARDRMDTFDVTVVRNSGAVIHYRDAYDAFRAHALATDATVYNALSGKADQVGKQYLIDLTADGWPVIPTFAGIDLVDRAIPATSYVIKPKDGADSIGLRCVPRDGLAGSEAAGCIVQPHLDLVAEISLVFVDSTFHYAVRTEIPAARWELHPYQPTNEEISLAGEFIGWNNLPHGIQRVDLARTSDGGLLLVELEDLNPYLSLDVLEPSVRDAFVRAMADSIEAAARTS